MALVLVQLRTLIQVILMIVLTCGNVVPSNAATMALTWTLKQVVGTSALFGGTTTQGDTPISERLSLLCVSNSNTIPKPYGLNTMEASGLDGTTINTWSGRQAFAIPDVLGSSLTSRARANNKCRRFGQLVYGNPMFQMAEFHHGSGDLSGWSYWVQIYNQKSGLGVINTSRYWVWINDHNSNPWS
jgi:hypothetical protein